MSGDPAGLRLLIFFSVLLLMLLLEWCLPRRAAPPRRRSRWAGNFGIQIVNGLVLRLLVPAGAVGFAVFYAEQGIGLFSGQQDWWVYLICLLVLDLAIYVQHVATHHVPLLWRLHRMHHSDTHIDATTALRFHPFEIVLSMLWKGAVLALLGAPVAAVLLFEIVLNATAMFNHANLSIPPSLDRVLRWFLVTPDMHRVHHSVHVFETNSNYGFNLPWWDRLFRSYRDQPVDSHESMRVGLEGFRSQHAQRLDQLLLQPWQLDHPRVASDE